MEEEVKAVMKAKYAERVRQYRKDMAEQFKEVCQGLERKQENNLKRLKEDHEKEMDQIKSRHLNEKEKASPDEGFFRAKEKHAEEQQLREELRESRKECDQTRDKLRKCRQECDSAWDETRKCRKECDNARHEQRRMKEEWDKTKNMLIKKFDQNVEELIKKRQECVEVAEEMRKTREERDDAVDEMKRYREKCDKAEDKLIKNRRKFEKVRDELVKKREECVEANKEIRRIGEERDTAKALMSQLQEKSLRSDLNQTDIPEPTGPIGDRCDRVEDQAALASDDSVDSIIDFIHGRQERERLELITDSSPTERASSSVYSHDRQRLQESNISTNSTDSLTSQPINTRGLVQLGLDEHNNIQFFY
ncbi:hypothetical protein WMY93_008111 [Mugilogobius chulae]|uniref:Uncharacterized protein n=1 Tax=Mugilogobius chulae TaxID=88201 RepID=A0AAW0PF57_9GOBI